jgi:hypothetical protein
LAGERRLEDAGQIGMVDCCEGRGTPGADTVPDAEMKAVAMQVREIYRGHLTRRANHEQPPYLGRQ